MKKFSIILSAILLSASALQAQVNKQVEVTKAYIPTVSKADKPLLPAFITDTAYINPDVDYSITPLSINTQLQTLPIKPATVTYWEFNKPSLGQVKVGAGVPLNSLLQLYLSSHNSSVGYVAAEVDHVGDYSDIKNSLGQKNNATQALNSAAISAGVYLGERALEAKASYFNNLYNKYAFEQTQSTFVKYQQAMGAIRFGDNFVDLDRFNFSIGGDYAHFFDKGNNIENLANFEALVAQELGLGNMYLGAQFKSISSSDTYNNQTATLHLTFDKIISNWQVIFGAQYYYDNNSFDESQTPNHYLIPRITVKRATQNPISLFAEVGGFLHQNNYAELSKINPYITPGLSAQSTVEYNFGAGIMGQNGSSTFAYRLYANYNMAFNHNFWGLCIIQDSSTETIYDNYFTLTQTHLNTTSANVEFSYKPVTNLALAFDAHYYLYGDYDKGEDNDNLFVNSKPNFDLALSADYTLRSFEMGVKAQLIGERDFSVYYNDASLTESTEVLPTAVDLSAYINWRASNKLSIFAEGSNLCNSDLYPWAMYRGFGVRLTAGVKLKF